MIDQIAMHPSVDSTQLIFHAQTIKQTLREKLPDDFQTAEYIQDHGFVDAIVPRPKLRSTLASLLAIHGQKAAALVG